MSYVKIARCPEHGLHGDRTACFVCGGDVEQVEMVPLRVYLTAVGILEEIVRQVVNGRQPEYNVYDGHVHEKWIEKARAVIEEQT